MEHPRYEQKSKPAQVSVLNLYLGPLLAVLKAGYVWGVGLKCIFNLTYDSMGPIFFISLFLI